jgi:hypothetical protein
VRREAAYTSPNGVEKMFLLYNTMKKWADTTDISKNENKEILRIIANRQASIFVGLTMNDLKKVDKEDLDVIIEIYNIVLMSDNAILKEFSAQFKSSLNKINPEIYNGLFVKRIMNFKNGGSYTTGSQVGGSMYLFLFTLILILINIEPVLYGRNEAIPFPDLTFGVYAMLFKGDQNVAVMPRRLLDNLQHASDLVVRSEAFENKISIAHSDFISALEASRFSYAEASATYGSFGVGVGASDMISSRVANERIAYQAFGPFVSGEASLSERQQQIGRLLARKPEVLALTARDQVRARAWFRQWTQEERAEAARNSAELARISDELLTRHAEVEALGNIVNIKDPRTALAVHEAIGKVLLDSTMEGENREVIGFIAPTVVRNQRKILDNSERAVKTLTGRVAELSTQLSAALRKKETAAAAEAAAQLTDTALAAAARDAADRAKGDEFENAPSENLVEKYRSASLSLSLATAEYDRINTLYVAATSELSDASNLLDQKREMIEHAVSIDSKGIESGSSTSTNLVTIGSKFDLQATNKRLGVGFLGKDAGLKVVTKVHGKEITIEIPSGDKVINYAMTPSQLVSYIDSMADTGLLLSDIRRATSGVSADKKGLELSVCGSEGGCDRSPIMKGLIKTLQSYAAEVALDNARRELTSLQSANSDFTLIATAQGFNSIASEIVGKIKLLYSHQDERLTKNGTDMILHGYAHNLIMDCYTRLGRRVPKPTSYDIMGEIVYKKFNKDTLELMPIGDLLLRLDINDLQNGTYLGIHVSASHNQALHRFKLLRGELFYFLPLIAAIYGDAIILGTCSRFAARIRRAAAKDARAAGHEEDLENREARHKAELSEALHKRALNNIRRDTAHLQHPAPPAPAAEAAPPAPATARPLPAGAAAAASPLRTLAKAAAAAEAAAAKRSSSKGGARFTRRRPRKQRRRISHATKRSARR